MVWKYEQPKHIFVYLCKYIQVIESNNFSKVSSHQIVEMICFIESHPEIAWNYLQSPSQGHENLHWLWNDFAKKLNSLGVIRKNAAQFKLLKIHCRLQVQWKSQTICQIVHLRNGAKCILLIFYFIINNYQWNFVICFMYLKVLLRWTVRPMAIFHTVLLRNESKWILIIAL